MYAVCPGQRIAQARAGQVEIAMSQHRKLDLREEDEVRKPAENDAFDPVACCLMLKGYEGPLTLAHAHINSWFEMRARCSSNIWLF